MTEWIKWDIENGPYPDERKWVVLLIKSSDNYLPNSLNVGYLRYAAGDKSCPYFVIPGGVKAIYPFIPLAYSEVLPDDFLYPKGYLTEAEPKEKVAHYLWFDNFSLKLVSNVLRTEDDMLSSGIFSEIFKAEWSKTMREI